MVYDESSKPDFESNENNENQQQEKEHGSSDELVRCLSERDGWKDKYLRVQADLGNITKRHDKERQQWKSMAQSAILTDLLPIVDDFDRAFGGQDKVADTQAALAGFEMIHKSLQKFLEKYDVREIPAGLPFDPMYHEALVTVEDSGRESGAIVAVLQKGYTFKETVLRPAKVSVAK